MATLRKLVRSTPVLMALFAAAPAQSQLNPMLSLPTGPLAPGNLKSMVTSLESGGEIGEGDGLQLLKAITGSDALSPDQFAKALENLRSNNKFIDGIRNNMKNPDFAELFQMDPQKLMDTLKNLREDNPINDYLDSALRSFKDAVAPALRDDADVADTKLDTDADEAFSFLNKFADDIGEDVYPTLPQLTDSGGVDLPSTDLEGLMDSFVESVNSVLDEATGSSERSSESSEPASVVEAVVDAAQTEDPTNKERKFFDHSPILSRLSDASNAIGLPDLADAGEPFDVRSVVDNLPLGGVTDVMENLPSLDSVQGIGGDNLPSLEKVVDSIGANIPVLDNAAVPNFETVGQSLQIPTADSLSNVGAFLGKAVEDGLAGPSTSGGIPSVASLGENVRNAVGNPTFTGIPDINKLGEDVGEAVEEIQAGGPVGGLRAQLEDIANTLDLSSNPTVDEVTKAIKGNNSIIDRIREVTQFDGENSTSFRNVRGLAKSYTDLFSKFVSSRTE